MRRTESLAFVCGITGFRYEDNSYFLFLISFRYYCCRRMRKTGLGKHIKHPFHRIATICKYSFEIESFFF